ncbi:MAG: hypothetical protein V1904_03155 [Bacteroidota bacterium]
MKRIIICAAAIMITMAANAQNDADALRYSMIGFGGTARYISMGGAFGAIGADFSTLSSNPAGIGAYRKNEITFTPSIYTGKTESSYNEKTSEDIKYNFNFSNLGMVFAFKTKNKDEAGWKSVNFGLGLNRYNNFHNSVDIQGPNHDNSLMTVYLDNAQGYTWDQLGEFDTQLAYYTYLLDTTVNGTTYSTPSNLQNGGMMQRKSIETRGAMQEMVITLGANYNNKLYIGGTIGIPNIRYHEHSTYNETDDADTLAGIESFTFNEEINHSGTGVNFKFGLIYVPVDVDMLKVKIGAAVHTPTFFNMHENWSSKMSSEFDNGENYSEKSPTGEYDFELTTPMRAIGSLAVQIGQYGTISADYEFVDYSEAKLDALGEKFFDENDNIQAKYTAQKNLRFGAEAALGLFSLRGGYAIYGSPYKSGINDGKKTVISGGFGIIDKGYFIDFAYAYSISNEDYYIYQYDGLNAADIKKISNNFLITLGFRF